jgi:hypothetical protein
MTFDEFLQSKKIDSRQFAEAEPLRFAEWRHLYEAMHPESFTAQKKFLINDVRRRYLLR